MTNSDTQWKETLSDGTPVLIRPIRQDDAEREREFIEALSPQSRYFRFLQDLKSPSPELIRRFTDIDQQHDVAFVALLGGNGATRQIGVSRYSVEADGASAECAVVVADAYQHKGLGTLLMRHLIEHARARGVKQLFSLDAANNLSMGEFAEYLGFRCERNPDDATMVVHRLHL